MEHNVGKPPFFNLTKLHILEYSHVTISLEHWLVGPKSCLLHEMLSGEALRTFAIVVNMGLTILYRE
jgi:hypothetical protein